MKRAVIDASVAAQWVVEEEHSRQAARLIELEELHAPDHWLAEAVNVVWSKVVRRQMAATDAAERVAILMRAPVIATPLRTLLPQALATSLRHSVTIYDALYVALALSRDLPFVTADRTLIRRLSGDPALSGRLQWVGDVES